MNLLGPESIPTAIEVDHLSKSFVRRRMFGGTEAAVKAVQDVTFSVRRGETLGLVGESGCGKSTLAKLLTLLEEPSGGQIRIEGRDITTLAGQERRRLRRDVQLIMQDPYGSLDPKMTVAQLIGEPFAIHPDVVPLRQRAGRVAELMEIVGLRPEHGHRYPQQFSGGQRQRIGIARALALNPKILICDEPVSALDVSIQAQILNLLADLQEEFNLSLVFIAHDLSVVRHLADRVAVMYLGRIVEIGSTRQIFEEPRHPYTRALLSAVPEPDPERDRTGMIRLEGDAPSPIAPPSGCAFHTRCFRKRDLSKADVNVADCSSELPRLKPVRPSGEHRAACHFPEPAASGRS